MTSPQASLFQRMWPTVSVAAFLVVSAAWMGVLGYGLLQMSVWAVRAAGGLHFQ